MNALTPTQQLSKWLADFDAALARGDSSAAAALFKDDGYWRDLVAFTWNIATAEGKPRILDMIEKAVLPAGPRGGRLDGEASKTDEALEGWFRFETAVARGYGHLRLVD